MSTLGLDGLGFFQKRKARKQALKRDLKLQQSKLLKDAGWHANRVVLITKTLLLLPVCVIVGKCVVSGAYDVLWETGAPLKPYGLGFITFGIVFPAWRIFLAKRRGTKTSVSSWIVVGLLPILIGVGYIVAAYRMQGVTTNTELWHALVPNKDFRDSVLRNEPEGLFSGLFWAYVSWNSLKRRQKKHWYDKPLKFMHFANLVQDDHERRAKAWMFLILPLMMLVFASPIFLGTWLLHVGFNYVLQHAHVLTHHGTVKHVNIGASTAVTAKIAKVLDTILGNWYQWLAGACASFFAKVPAFGLIDQLDEEAAQKRVARKKGDLKRALGGFTPKLAGRLARISAEWHEASDPEILWNPEFASLNLTDLPSDEARAAAFSTFEIDNRDPGIAVIMRNIVGWSTILFFVGMYFLYLLPHVHH